MTFHYSKQLGILSLPNNRCSINRGVNSFNTAGSISTSWSRGLNFNSQNVEIEPAVLKEFTPLITLRTFIFKALNYSIAVFLNIFCKNCEYFHFVAMQDSTYNCWISLLLIIISRYLWRPIYLQLFIIIQGFSTIELSSLSRGSLLSFKTSLSRGSLLRFKTSLSRGSLLSFKTSLSRVRYWASIHHYPGVRYWASKQHYPGVRYWASIHHYPGVCNWASEHHYLGFRYWASKNHYPGFRY